MKCGKHDARILCTDLVSNDGSIVCAVKSLCGNTEFIQIFNKDGTYISDEPSELTDLFLVKQEFEDGDIIKRYKHCFATYIIPYRGTDIIGAVLTEAYYSYSTDSICIWSKIDWGCGNTNDYHLATEDEKKIFFEALAKEGKKWNSEKKCIEDIKEEFKLNPFQKVLVRDYKSHLWVISFFGYYSKNSEYRYKCMDSLYRECIPYNDETKNLLGTAEDCPDKYKTWKN